MKGFDPSVVGPLFTVLLGWFLLTIYLVWSALPVTWPTGNPVVRPAIRVRESFQNGGSAVGVSEAISSSAGDPGLHQPRAPYSLLKGVLPPFQGTPPRPTSESCYEGDFQKRIERTGNFRQLTNNYKRGDPESCSAPLHDLSLATYSVEPLAYS